MYGLLILNSKIEGHFSKRYQLILLKDEMDKIKNYFCWKIGVEGHIVSCRNFLNKKEKQILLAAFPGIDLLLNDYQIEFSNTLENHFFSKKDYINKILWPLQRRCAPYLGISRSPLKSRPTFINGDIYIWYEEFGLYEKCDYTTTESKGFFHPETKMLLFKNENEHFNYLAQFKKISKKIDVMEVEDFTGKYFIRVISVYDKDSNILKYRITNEQFDEQSVGFFMLKPFEKDEGLFFRSYEINKKIADYINSTYDSQINFDFDKNKYFFETLDATNYIYSYNDFIQNLNIL